ncbi:MAG: flagellar assembly protein FliW [Oscillospiraceae bacterium]|nr:flagellar assembly protein FliW [Oscillospiraceae bacterium]
MMKIKTRDFGEIEINESTIINIPDGIIGFESVKRYTLIYPLGENTFPMWLQAVDSVEPCFVVYNPMQIYPDYRFEISDEEQATLKIDEDTPYSCLAVAIVPDDYKQTTINLRCPIVLNIRDNIAAQVILEDYEFKYPVYAPKED